MAGSQTSFTWNTSDYQANVTAGVKDASGSAQIPLAMATYNLWLYDASRGRDNYTGLGGGIDPYSGLLFGLYLSQPYQDLAGE